MAGTRNEKAPFWSSCSVHPGNFAGGCKMLVMLSESGFRMVLLGLIILPVVFSHFLLQCEALVVRLQFLVGLHALLRVFVFKHTSHASNRLSLLCEGFLFKTVLLSNEPFLTGLLICPVLLILRVNLHSLMIH